ncbi:E4 [Human papillomavirus 175]|uniref:E4 n=1 Tax=Human papillomavirus 175 TaxID=1434782 RepID=L7X3H2_9PAPI|nr:E4 [Human papillomavirus 175]AGC93432.1 E4 [Human papillomavirus 175]
MVFIMRKVMEIEHTIFCLNQTQQGMEKLDNGLCSLKIKLFLPLYLAHTGRTPLFPPKGLSAPPATPFPHRRASHPGGIQDPTKAKREALVAPPGPRRRLQFDNDDDDEKENQRPPPEKLPETRDNDEPERWSVLGYLLEKWEADIERFQQQVLQDLQDLKLKLGIH